jgi:vancomycin resistance protein VanJ
VVVLFGFQRFRLPGAPAPAGPGRFTLVTHNIGEGNKLAFDKAFPGQEPDAILLQDAINRQRDYARRFPALHTRAVAQFLLLTPHEITEGAPVSSALWRGNPVAARFVVRADGHEIALYSVHLPTPRRSLRGAFSPRVALEMLWLAKAPTDDHPSYRDWLQARVALARELSTAFQAEKLPFLVAGDLNTPDHGSVYRAIATNLRDAHREAGRGWGFTFPADGAKDGRLAVLFGPWLRLDYIFAGRGFVPLECKVASDDASQHRAVLAHLSFAP